MVTQRIIIALLTTLPISCGQNFRQRTHRKHDDVIQVGEAFDKLVEGFDQQAEQELGEYFGRDLQFSFDGRFATVSPTTSMPSQRPTSSPTNWPTKSPTISPVTARLVTNPPTKAPVFSPDTIISGSTTASPTKSSKKGKSGKGKSQNDELLRTDGKEGGKSAKKTGKSKTESDELVRADEGGKSKKTKKTKEEDKKAKRKAGNRRNRQL